MDLNCTKKLKDIDNKIEACFITALEDYREESKNHSQNERKHKTLLENQKL